MSRYLLATCLFCLSLVARAHSPDVSSTLLVEESEGNWLLQIRAALTAFEYEVENHYGQSSYATPEEFQELVIKHIQENLSVLSNNGTSAGFQDGLVKLGHETSVTFNVKGIPATINSLQIANSSFANIPRNQSALVVLKKGFTKSQFKLDKNNSHKVQLSVGDSQFVIAEPVETKSGLPASFLIVGGLLFCVMPLLLIFKNKKRGVTSLRENAIAI